MSNTLSVTSFLRLFENSNLYFYNTSFSSPLHVSSAAKHTSDRRFVRVFDEYKYKILNDDNYKEFYGKDVYIDLPHSIYSSLPYIMRQIFSVYRIHTRVECNEFNMATYRNLSWPPNKVSTNSRNPFKEIDLRNYFNLIDLHVNVNKNTEWLDHNIMVFSETFKHHIQNHDQDTFIKSISNTDLMQEHVEFFAYLNYMYPFVTIYKKPQAPVIKSKIMVDSEPLYHCAYIETSIRKSAYSKFSNGHDMSTIRISDNDVHSTYVQYSSSIDSVPQDNRLKLHGLTRYGYTMPSSINVRGNKGCRWQMYQSLYVYNILKAMYRDFTDLTINDILLIAPSIRACPDTSSPYKLIRLLTCTVFKDRIKELHDMVTSRTISGKRVYELDWNRYF